MADRELIIISCQPDDDYFVWECEVQITNYRKYGYSDKLRYLMFLPNDRVKSGWNPKMKELEVKYPEVKFFWYEDTHNLLDTYIRPFNYIPLLRPFVLAAHFKEHPELKDAAIYYCDSDVIFTKYLDFSPFLGDDICYLSNTKSYIAASYFDSKEKDVLPEKLEEYKKIDVLDGVMKLFGLSREDAVANEEGSGGAQYLLKDIDASFWNAVFGGCIMIRSYLQNINKLYFENEDKGFQSWCADMWSVLFNLWRIGKVTKCPPEMEFAWATDKIAEWDNKYLYHDAGAGLQPLIDEKGFAHNLFFKKGRDNYEYTNNRAMPYVEDFSYVSHAYCSYNYVQEILRTKELNNY